MPSGRERPPVAPAESATGSTGSTQGETAVAAPAIRAKAIKRTMSGTFPHRRYGPGQRLVQPAEGWAGAAGSASGGRGLRGDGAGIAAGDLRRPADALADAVVLADRQLVLA